MLHLPLDTSPGGKTSENGVVLVYKALNGSAPKHIVDLLTPYVPTRPLQSSGSGLSSVPRVEIKHRKAAFSFYAPHI